MRRTRNPHQKRGSKTRAAQLRLEQEIIKTLRVGGVIRDCDGNCVTSANLDTFERLMLDASRNKDGLFGTMDYAPELARELLKTRQSKNRRYVQFLQKDGTE